MVHSDYPCVPDGPVDPSRFERARIRIVWFLKQVNDPGHTWTGLLDMLRQFGTERQIDKNGQPT